MHVLVRPRGGGFVYEADELDTIARDIRAAIGLGADGVVVGALTDAGELDLEAIARFVEAADDTDVTVHRAVDASVRPVEAVDALAALGVRRVLTSGGAADCRAGLTTLQAMIAASGALEVMAGGGVRDPRHRRPRSRRRRRGAPVGARHDDSRRARAGPAGESTGFDVTDPGLVRAAVVAARLSR